MLTLLRFGAVSGVLCGLSIGVPGAVEVFTGETIATSVVLGISPAFAPPLLVALHLRQAAVAGALGSVGYAANLIGLALFGGAAFALNLILVHLDPAVLTDLLAGPARLALLGAALVFVVGTVLFGVAMFRARVFPRPAAASYAVALPLFALAAPLPDTVQTSGLHVLVGLTLVWLSLGLRARLGTWPTPAPELVR
jgi:hypothetical protein